MKISEVLALFFIIGWLANVIQVVLELVSAETLVSVSGLLILKAICIFIYPVGAVLGWIGLF